VRYTALLAGAPVPRDVARQIGEWSMTLREPDVAIHWLDEAIDPVTPDPALLIRLAEARTAANDFDAAEATLARARQYAPSDPRLHRAESALARARRSTTGTY
jgi:Flp pilus assembly protein TadD